MDRFEILREKILPVLKPYVQRISVFGSFARGEMKPNSDVDLLVQLKPAEVRPSVGLFQWMSLEDELEERLNCGVDLVTEDGVSPYILPFINQDKVVLYEEG